MRFTLGYLFLLTAAFAIEVFGLNLMQSRFQNYDGSLADFLLWLSWMTWGAVIGGLIGATIPKRKSDDYGATGIVIGTLVQIGVLIVFATYGLRR